MITFALSELSTLVSNLTLIYNQPVKLHFFDETTIYDDKRRKHTLQGVSFKGGCYELDENLKAEISKCKYIHINKEYTYEVLLTIASPEAMNLWYKQRWEGKVADKVCRKFNFFDGSKIDPDEIKEYRKQVEEELKDKLLTI